jgi:hypothetical protein
MNDVIKAMVVAALGAVLGYALGRVITAHVVVARFPTPINPTSIMAELNHKHAANGSLPSPPSIKSATATSFSLINVPTPIRLRHFKTWVREQPEDALYWLLSGEARAAGLSDLQIKDHFSSALNILRTGREESAFTRRKAWTGALDQTFELAEKWQRDGGKILRADLENEPRATDLLWLLADVNPAHSLSATTEWIASAPGQATERARIVEQLARRSLDAGEIADFAITVSGKTEPVFDRAKAFLVAEIIETSPEIARLLWDSIPRSRMRLLAAADLLSREFLKPETRLRMLSWADPEWRDLLPVSNTVDLRQN